MLAGRGLLGCCKQLHDEQGGFVVALAINEAKPTPTLKKRARAHLCQDRQDGPQVGALWDELQRHKVLTRGGMQVGCTLQMGMSATGTP